jgi:tetratricopeptide (TPR) repeat protein
MLARRFLGLLLLCISVSSRVAAQTASDDAYKAERLQAITLFNQQKQLEALPLFEDLAKKNSDDAYVLFGLGACLVNHSATLPDEDAARKERVRAREYLLRAKQLGNTSGLLFNLLDLLPPDGSIRHQDNAEVDKAIQAGEAAFAKRDFDEALKNYLRAFELDPRNYAAALFIADSYFAKKDFAKAGEGYERAIQVNPDTETAYRYEADMLIKSGEMEKARLRSIQAVVAEPYNPITWRGLAQWANSCHVQLVQVHIEAHASATTDGRNTTITLNPNMNSGAGAVWLAYGATRDLWQNEKFKKSFPQEAKYRHSLPEEFEALSLAAKVLPRSEKDPAYTDPSLVMLKKLSDGGMLEPYILLNAADQGIAQDYAAYRAENRSKLEAYLSQFVVPATPPTPKPVTSSSSSGNSFQ